MSYTAKRFDFLDKPADYARLAQELSALLAGESDLVANAANTAVVLGELLRRCAGAVVHDETDITGLIAIQGPNAASILSRATDLPLEDMRDRARELLPKFNAEIAVYCGKFT